MSTQSDHLDAILNAATPVPEMPSARILEGAMAAFPAKRSFAKGWAALAATLVVGVAGFMALQTYQAHQQTIMADADAFADELVSEVY
jgi:hypothetical protein